MTRQKVPEAVRIAAPAKVNLILRVLDRRPDGYHNLWSLMQTVALEDHLEFFLRPNPSGIRLKSNLPSMPTDGRNLIVRAASLCLQRAGRSDGLDIRATKRIPVGAGLGGGSSDAAATILCMKRLLGQAWSSEEMGRIGQEVGSDVPFFFSAPTAVVTGRGENVAPIRLEGERWVLLVRPGFGIETKWAYDQLARRRTEALPVSLELEELGGKPVLSWDDVTSMMANDFEGALADAHEEFREIKHTLMAQGAEAALISGSGSTVFGLFGSKAHAIRAQDAFAERREFWSTVARTCDRPLEEPDPAS